MGVWEPPGLLPSFPLGPQPLPLLTFSPAPPAGPCPGLGHPQLAPTPGLGHPTCARTPPPGLSPGSCPGCCVTLKCFSAYCLWFFIWRRRSSRGPGRREGREYLGRAGHRLDTSEGLMLGGHVSPGDSGAAAQRPPTATCRAQQAAASLCPRWGWPGSGRRQGLSGKVARTFDTWAICLGG